MLIRTAVQRSFGRASAAGRRLASHSPVGISRGIPETTPAQNRFLPNAYQYSFRKAYLADPSTYPLFGVWVVAGFLIVGFSANALFRYKGVKLSTEHKRAVIPDWEDPTDRQTSITEVLARPATSFHSPKYDSIQQEGLGVDHNQWKAAKEAYDGIKRA